jgi:diguanylate cyclase (GGDEF)-like protein/PAS domain S-box-containing protein
LIFKPTSISVAIFIAFFVNIFVAYSSWQRRKTKGGVYFAFAMLSITFWTLAAGLDYAAVPIPLKVFFAKLEYLGYMSAVALFAAFSLSYAGYEDYLKKTWVNILLIGIPASNILFAWTNELHGWIWSGFRVNDSADNVIIFEHGPAFTWVVFSGYALILIIFVSLLQASLKGTGLARKQARLLLFALLALVASNLIYLSDLFNIPGVDWSSITFSITGILFLFALYGSRFMDVVPVARNIMIERMADGVLVLDSHGRLVDFNPTAQAIFDIKQQDLWAPFQVALARWPEIIALLKNPARTEPMEVTFRKHEKVFELRLTPMEDNRNQVYGILFVMRDITQRKLIEDALQKANQRMENQLKEIGELQAALREQANRDSLTQLYNRRFLVDALEREFLLAQRYSQSLSIVLIDIDHFKSINDSYGHNVGDECLVRFSQLMQQHFRKSDIICRYGGEEFLIVLPDSNTDLSAQRVEEFRQLVSSTSIQSGIREIRFTISSGIATFQVHGENPTEIIQKADYALYVSKNKGRNQVTAWSDDISTHYPRL